MAQLSCRIGAARAAGSDGARGAAARQPLVHAGEDHRHEQQRRDGREQQAADDRAAERRVLLGAFADAERHRDHADDHRQRRHQHRPDPRGAGFERGRQRRHAFVRRWRANETSRMLFAVATPIVMIAPVSAGTDSVVPVMKSIQAMPASAAGSAAMMIDARRSTTGS